MTDLNGCEISGLDPDDLLTAIREGVAEGISEAFPPYEFIATAIAKGVTDAITGENMVCDTIQDAIYQALKSSRNH